MVAYEGYSLQGDGNRVGACFQLRAGKASLVDGTAINWSVGSAPVKTNHNILATEKLTENN